MKTIKDGIMNSIINKAGKNNANNDTFINGYTGIENSSSGSIGNESSFGKSRPLGSYNVGQDVQSIHTTRNSARKLFDDIREKEEAINKLNSQKTTLMGRVRELQSDCESKSEEISQKNQEIQKLKREKEEKEQKIRDLDSNIKKLKEQNQRWQNQVKICGQDVPGLIRTLKNQIETRQNRIEELRAQLNALNNRGMLTNVCAFLIASVSNICTTTANEICRVESSIKQERQEIEKMQLSLNACNQSVETAKEIKSKYEELKVVQSTIQSDEEKLKSKYNELAELNEKFEACKAEQRSKEEKLNTLTGKIRRMHDEVSAILETIKKVSPSEYDHLMIYLSLPVDREYVSPYLNSRIWGNCVFNLAMYSCAGERLRDMIKADLEGLNQQDSK